VDPDVSAKAVTAAPTDLAWLFGDHGVDVHVQGVSLSHWLRQDQTLHWNGMTRAEVKLALSKHLGMNAADSLAMGVQVA